ncbi:MAG: DNA primase [Planctomycetota bacterium]|jgi:DNA primase|nr:DNA primase [Planctomycetota bacterium]
MAIYRKDFIERVRSASDLAQVAADYNVQLKRAGANLLGLCPFHNEKTPSFNVRPAEQYFYCFGCGAKGDVFRLVQMLEKVEFPEAVRLLAERAGLPPEFDSPAAAREAAERTREKGSLLWCCSRALEYFEACLAGPEGGAARDYLASRGFTNETIRRWRLGWAPDRWDGLGDFLLKNAKEPGQNGKVLAYGAEAGVLRPREEGRGYYDFFRGRVIFPIMDVQSRPVAFGGRLLQERPEAGGKYVNSAETRLFSKKRTLFGLNQAGKEIALSGEAVVVEGYVDVVMCHQYGIRNVVGVLGTALTDEHAELLRRQVAGKGRVVAFFDADAAGEKATLRAISLFMARDAPLAVAGKLGMKDAGEFLPQHGAEKFRERIKAAEDSFSCLLSRTIGRARGGDIDAMGRAVRELLETVDLCPDPVKLALMRRRIAAEAGVPEEALPAALPATAGSAGRRGGGPGLAAGAKARPAWKPGLAPPGGGLAVADALERSREARRRREARLLRYVWESPEWAGRLFDQYPPDEWLDPALAELAERIRDARAAGREISLASLRADASEPEAAERLADLVFAGGGPELSEKDFSLTLALVLYEGIKEEMRNIREELIRAQKSGDSEREEELLREYMRLRAGGGR